jgi:hypothetical protein
MANKQNDGFTESKLLILLQFLLVVLECNIQQVK